MKSLSKILLTVLFAVVVVVGAAYFYAWAGMGLREYQDYMKSIGTIKDGDKRTYVINSFFLPSSRIRGVQMIGGVLARVGNEGVWIWDRDSKPALYKWSKGVVYSVARNCNVDMFVKSIAGDQDAMSSFDNSPSLSEWKTQAGAGTHIYMYLNGASEVIEITANPDVKTSGLLPVFCTREGRL